MKLTRLSLMINGIERFIVCDPEEDNLAEVLRRMGLTGVKVVCGAGVCGACSIILNGKVVRACSRKMKAVAEFSEIITIEGIGTPKNLHPLQQAWITYGGISHSIGFALMEDYDARDKHGDMVGCGIPTIDVIPDDMQLIFTETPRPAGPHGSCGCSEVFQCCNHMAVINAINNACGVRICALPATPEKVKAGWEAKQRGDELPPAKYYLGSDFEEELETIKANPIGQKKTAVAAQ